MNFLTRNLGWLLLLLFFLFMLFVISTNDPSKKNIALDSLSGSIQQDDTGDSLEAEKELDNLVKRVEGEEDVISETEGEELEGSGALLKEEKKGGLLSFFNFGKDKDKETQEIDGEEVTSGEVDQEGGTEDVTEAGVRTIGDALDTDEGSGSGELAEEEAGEKESLFDKLFGKKTASGETLEGVGEGETEDSIDENMESQTNDVTKSEVNKEVDDTQETLSEETQMPSEVKNVGGNMSKVGGGNVVLSNASMAYMHQYPKELVDPALMYPGLNLKSGVGKHFEVGVHMLKLNNANFNVKLALMNQGDKLKQLTKENAYGCFLIEVIAAKNKANIGKKGYVCKKYLQKASKKKGKKASHMAVPTTHVEVPTTSDSAESFLPEENNSTDETDNSNIIVPTTPAESFLPEDDTSNAIVPVDSFLPEEPVVVPNSNSNSSGFALPQESSQAGTESFLPEEPIVIPDSGESFLPEEDEEVNTAE